LAIERGPRRYLFATIDRTTRRRHWGTLFPLLPPSV